MKRIADLIEFIIKEYFYDLLMVGLFLVLVFIGAKATTEMGKNFASLQGGIVLGVIFARARQQAGIPVKDKE